MLWEIVFFVSELANKFIADANSVVWLKYEDTTFLRKNKLISNYIGNDLNI